MNNTAGQVKDAPSQFNEAPACIVNEEDILLNDGFAKHLLSAPQVIDLEIPPRCSRYFLINASLFSLSISISSLNILIG